MSATLLSLCQQTAFRLDDIKVYGVTGGTSTTVTVPALVDASTGASTSAYDGAWIYNEGQQMRVRVDGYAPSTGILTVFPPWTVTPANGEEVSITHLFPIGTAATAGEDTPYQVHVQNALRYLIYPDIISLAITSSDSYTLATYQDWLDRQERLIGIREPAPISGRRPVDASWRNPRVEQAGTSVSLRLDAPFGSGVSGNLMLDVLRPPYSLVNGAESTTGPTADADTVEANADDVIEGALTFAYLALAVRQASSPDGADWAAKYADQRDRFMALQAFDRTRTMPAPPVSAGRVA